MKRLMSIFKWLYPGMRVKRWLLLTPIGVFLVVIGVTLMTNMRVVDYLDVAARFVAFKTGWVLSDPKVYLPISIGAIIIGLTLIFISFRQVIDSITSVVSPGQKDRLADIIYQRRSLAQGHKIVVIGGGTGLSTMLRGLKQHTSNLVAIVTVADDGGSSGVLQRQLGLLPPGDIRNCIVALADEETLMTELLQHRFNDAGEGLSGHTLGNLLIAAMTDITGDFEEAIKETSKVLAIRGRVLPATLDRVTLRAELDDGSIVNGETNIANTAQKIRKISLVPNDVKPLKDALEAIRTADAIVIGPGSVYTSIVPNLLVQGTVDALAASNAVKIYVCNVMTQPGETDHFHASDHVKAVADHAGKKVFDYVLVNKAVPSIHLLEKYHKKGAELVSPDVDIIQEMGYKPITGNFISQTDVVRHDPEELAQAILRLMLEKTFLPK